jgi:large subunit ribosomal protein L21
MDNGGRGALRALAGQVLGVGFDGFGLGEVIFGVFLRFTRDFSGVCFFFSLIPLTFAALISFIMLAVVKIAGQQFKVQKDQTLYVPRIAGNAGDKVEFAEVLLTAGDTLASGKDVKAVIKAEILDHVQGDKVIAFKMKRRKGFRKKHGHRTHYTKIKINEIA